MKITINSKNLLTAVQKVGGCIRSKNIIPILDSLLVINDGQNLLLTGSNTEITATTSIKATIEGKIRTCIPYETLLSILKNFPSAPVTITLNTKVAKLQCGKSRYEVPLYDPIAFPKDGSVEWSNTLKINTDKFCEGLKKALSFTDQSDDLSGFNAICFYSKGTHAKISGITPHKSFETTICENKSEFRLGMHGSAANYLSNQPIEDEELEISYSHSMIQLKGDKTTIKITQVNKFPPDHEPIFAAHVAKNKARLKKDEFLSNINKLSPISGYNAIKFDIGQDKITATAENSFTTTKGKEVFDCELEGKPFVVGFSGNILKSMLRVISEDELTLEISEPRRPCIVQTKESRILVMPHSI